MDKVYSRINWENEPSVSTPINETNLNKMDYAIDQLDNRSITVDTTKANQSDLLQSVKSITYDTTTGVFVFTWWNGSTLTADLNIEKIPVSFSMDADGVITMKTTDGQTYTADVGSLIKTYTFNDSARVDFTTTTDDSGNKTVTADLVKGSITDEYLQPNYLADITTQASSAKTSMDNASTYASNASTSATNAKASEDKAKEYMEEAKQTDVGTLTTEVSALKYDITHYEEHGFLGKGVIDFDVTNITTDNATYVKDGNKYEVTPSVAGGRIMLNNISVDSTKTYTLSFDVQSNNLGCSYSIGWAGCGKVISDAVYGRVSATFTGITTSTFSIYVNVKNNTLIVSNIMLEEGTEATSYAPYAPSNTELSNTLTPNSFSVTTTNSNITNLTNNSWRIGHHVHISCYFQITDSIEAFSPILTLESTSRYRTDSPMYTSSGIMTDVYVKEGMANIYTFSNLSAQDALCFIGMDICI